MTTPLVSPHWLHLNINNVNLVVLDATINKVGGIEPADELQGLKIMGGRFFDLKNEFSDQKADLPNTAPSPEQFEKACNLLGINKNSKIVIYDKHGIYSGPRAWWLFKTMGHDQVAVLDGGLPAWVKMGYETEADEVSLPLPGNFSASYNEEKFCDSSQVLKAKDDDNFLILDARSSGRFYGTSPEPRKNLRAGHIPNSVNLPYSRIVVNGTMLPPKELKKIFDELNPDHKKLIFLCGSGVTACVIALGATLAGHDATSVYDGSWSDWGRPSDLPVEKD
jgi:thiosulfate/3-mercaptopyruvate sulfurtransferase